MSTQSIGSEASPPISALSPNIKPHPSSQSPQHHPSAQAHHTTIPPPNNLSTRQSTHSKLRIPQNGRTLPNPLPPPHRPRTHTTLERHLRRRSPRHRNGRLNTRSRCNFPHISSFSFFIPSYFSKPAAPTHTISAAHPTRAHTRPTTTRSVLAQQPAPQCASAHTADSAWEPDEGVSESECYAAFARGDEVSCDDGAGEAAEVAERVFGDEECRD